MKHRHTTTAVTGALVLTVGAGGPAARALTAAPPSTLADL